MTCSITNYNLPVLQQTQKHIDNRSSFTQLMMRWSPKYRPMHVQSI